MTSTTVLADKARLRLDAGGTPEAVGWGMERLNLMPINDEQKPCARERGQQRWSSTARARWSDAHRNPTPPIFTWPQGI